MSRVERYVCAYLGRRDYNQLPVALAEADMLDTFITDGYYTGLPAPWERWVPASLLEKLRRRNDPRIPPDRVMCHWALIAEQRLRRWLGFTEWQLFAKVDRRLSLAAAKRARRSCSNLLLYNPYAWEAFTCRYRHDPKKVLFQYHPHPDLERSLLLADSAKHQIFDYSYEQEMGDDADEGAKRRSRECWRHADLILCASSFTKRSLVAAGADPALCEVVPYGIDLPARSGDTEGADSFRVAFVGSGTQRKGLHHLLLAWRNAVLPHGSRLTIVCRFIDSGVKALARATPGVEVLAGVSANELQRLYAQSALFAMPSLVEGFGQVYLEALVEGCPVLGTPNTGLPDIGPSSAIFLVEPGDINGLTAELERLSEFLPGNRTIRAAARACAMQWPWARFRGGVRAALDSGFRPAFVVGQREPGDCAAPPAVHLGR